MDRASTRRLTYGILTATLLAIIISDWPSGILTTFWAEHAMLTNALSSVIFLAVGATVVERWLSRQDDKRFEVVEAIAFGAIARVLLATRNALWFLINGSAAEDDEDFKIGESERRLLASLLRKQGLAPVELLTVARGESEVPDDVTRLMLLMSEPEWRGLAHTIIRNTILASRVIVARWAQLLATSKQSSHALRELTGVLDDLRELRRPIALFHKEILPSKREQEEFIKLWRKCFVNASVVYEDLMITARSPGFFRWSFQLVQPNDRERMTTLGIVQMQRSPNSGRVYESAHSVPVRLTELED